MSSLTDSGEYVCKEGLFRLPQSSVMKKCVLELGQEPGRKLYIKIEQSSRLMSSMNNFQLAIVQIYVFLKLAIDFGIIPDTFSKVFARIIRMIQNLCSLVSISEAADVCCETVKCLRMNDIVIKHPYVS